MDDKQSIRVNIGGKFFPLTIERNQEELIRKAAKLINDKLIEYKKRFTSINEYDYLAMTALHLSTELLQNDSSEDFKLINSEIRQLNEDLKEYIKEHK